MFVLYTAINDIAYVDSEGKGITGMKAAQELQEIRKKWEGPLTNGKLQEVIRANNEVNQSYEAKSDDINDNNIAFGKKQEFEDIRMLLNYAFSDFQNYDYYGADSLKPEDAEKFYGRRVENLQEWLYSESGANDQFTEVEKQFLLSQYKKLQSPLVYENAVGWEQIFTYSTMILMILSLVISYLVAGIFSCERQLKADAIFFHHFMAERKQSKVN